MTDLEILDHADTSIGVVYLGRRQLAGEWVYQIHIEHELLMSSVNPFSERELSCLALAYHQGDRPLSVLVGGLGLGYTAQAALQNTQVESLRVAEKMDFIIGWMRDGKLPLSAELAADDRLQIAQTDVYADLLGRAQTTYDLILVDVDHAPDSLLSDASAPFYTIEGQARVAAHLAPGGVLAVWSATPSESFAEVMKASYADAQCDDIRWHDDENPETPYHNVVFLGRTSQ